MALIVVVKDDAGTRTMVARLSQLRDLWQATDAVIACWETA